MSQYELFGFNSAEHRGKFSPMFKKSERNNGKPLALRPHVEHSTTGRNEMIIGGEMWSAFAGELYCF
jgi:hypothetical protein